MWQVPIHTPGQTLGQALGQQTPVDPLLHAGLRTAGQLLARNDPGAPETMDLIEGAIAAGGPSEGSDIARLSDLNSDIRAYTFYRANKGAVTLGLLLVPVLAFALGRYTGKRG